MDDRHITDQQQVLAELARAGESLRQETSLVISPGAGVTAWAVKIKSHVGYNIYEVRAVTVGEPGSIPAEFGESQQAVNLAESFVTEGTLAVGTYALMARVGDGNVFYAVP